MAIEKNVLNDEQLEHVSGGCPIIIDNAYQQPDIPFWDHYGCRTCKKEWDPDEYDSSVCPFCGSTDIKHFTQ